MYNGSDDSFMFHDKRHPLELGAGAESRHHQAGHRPHAAPFVRHHLLESGYDIRRQAFGIAVVWELFGEGKDAQLNLTLDDFEPFQARRRLVSEGGRLIDGR
jgi:hypothetical protein